MSKTNAAAVTTPAPELTPEQDATNFLVSLREGANSDGIGEGGAPTDDPPTEGESSEIDPEDDQPKEPPAQKDTPEEVERKLRVEYARKMNEADSRAASARRKEQALHREREEFERAKAEFERERKQFVEVASVEDMVSLVAKQSRRSELDVWHEIADMLRNNGKRSKESDAMAEVRKLREERERERAETEERARVDKERREATEAREIETQWKANTVQIARSDAERWPLLSGVRPEWIGIAALNVTKEHFERTNEVASQEEVLDYLEKLERDEQEKTNTPQAKAPPKANKQQRTITNSDASDAQINKRSEDMSEAERMADAAAYLRSLNRQKG